MRKLVSVCLALILLLACIPLTASADGTPTFAVGSADAHAGETVDIPVLIENNPGIIALKVSISFNSAVLTLQDVAWASLFVDGDGKPTGVYTPSGEHIADGTVNILWVDGTGENATADGTIAMLTFLVAEDASEGEIPVSVSYSASNTFNRDLTEVAFGTRDGAVTVLPKEIGGWSFSEDCTLYTYETANSGLKFVGGLDIIDPVISPYVITTGGWSYTVEPTEYSAEATGAKLIIYDENGDVAEEYWSVLFGDVNGNAIVDGNDATLLIYAMGNTLDEEEVWSDFIVTDEYPQSFAADVDHNGVLDGMDLTQVIYQMGNTEDIDQMME